ncbi:hypothetical protein PoB_006944200 [Plakobranchus ocellatus]|uniref:Uncharacterized protein n=1 Tax=Plakobranchus ocellatus TaxID=259542 RepID=A0AAV4DFZ6_9GAST|nr:hypothetical protein PoB_006944200 [Plakobranchus ocellatus]
MRIGIVFKMQTVNKTANLVLSSASPTILHTYRATWRNGLQAVTRGRTMSRAFILIITLSFVMADRAVSLLSPIFSLSDAKLDPARRSSNIPISLLPLPNASVCKQCGKFKTF